MDIVERLSKLDDDSQKVLRMAYYEIKRLREALQSIANNSCCGTCQEAALIARKALGEKE